MGSRSGAGHQVSTRTECGLRSQEVRDGIHEVPEEVKELWLKCQGVKEQRTRHKEGRPRLHARAYPFTRVTICDNCGLPYGGQPSEQKSGKVVRRLYHKRPYCDLKPHSVRVENLMAQFHEGVLPYIGLDEGWEAAVVRALRQETEAPDCEGDKIRLEQALTNLRKQHQWGDITDEEYREERRPLDRQLKTLAPTPVAVHVPNLKRAAELLAGLPALWTHPGVTDYQREEFIREVFEQVHVRGTELVAIQPKTSYQPLFGYIVAEGVRKCRGGQIRTADLLHPHEPPLAGPFYRPF